MTIKNNANGKVALSYPSTISLDLVGQPGLALTANYIQHEGHAPDQGLVTEAVKAGYKKEIRGAHAGAYIPLAVVTGPRAWPMPPNTRTRRA